MSYASSTAVSLFQSPAPPACGELRPLGAGQVFPRDPLFPPHFSCPSHQPALNVLLLSLLYSLSLSPSPRADKEDRQEVVSGLSRGEEEARKGSSDASPPPPSGSADTSGDSEPAGEGGPFVGELRVGRAAGELGV